MNLRCLTAAAAAVAAFTTAPALASDCATVEVHNVRAQQGSLMLAAYSSAESFGKKPLAALRVAAGETTMRVQLCGLSGQEVALTLFQDLNDDGKMGRNAFGMPTEPWGASGSPGAMGPSWDSARVPLNGSVIVVQMST